MSPRFWIVLAALFGGLAVVAGAVGAHSLPDSSSLAVPVRIFSTGQLYHAVHSLALLAVATIMLATENRRTGWSGLALQVAAVAFTVGIVCFSGGIYAQVANGFTSSGGVVPVGGVSFLVGWIAFAAGAFGIDRA